MVRTLGTMADASQEISYRRAKSGNIYDDNSPFLCLKVRTLGTFSGVLGYIYAPWCGLCEHFGVVLGVSMAEKPLQTAFFPEVRTSFCRFDPPGANFGNISLDASQGISR